MYYNFDTNDFNAATAALLVYAIYRSRDISQERSQTRRRPGRVY